MGIKDNYKLKASDPFTLAGRQEITVDLALEKKPQEPCTLLMGTVSGKCGRTPGATVKIFDILFNPIAHTLTDDEGCFIFQNILLPGEYFVVATAEGYEISEACKILICQNKPLFISICLKNAIFQTGVYGTVYDETNSKLANVNLMILEDNNISRCVAITQTNDEGEYFIYGLKKGKYLIYASKEGYYLPYKHPFFLYNNFLLVNLFLFPDLNRHR